MRKQGDRLNYSKRGVDLTEKLMFDIAVLVTS